MSLKKILIIDDEADFGRLVKLNLELRGGFSVSTALDGRQGIALAKKIKPDLILLDLLMPGIDGFETMEILNREKETKNIPVVMLSAREDEASRMKASLLAGKYYIAKPIEADELVAIIENALRKRPKPAPKEGGIDG